MRFASRPPKAWANGGGSTRVLVDDADALVGEWTYRVSVADLSGHQPFSRFEGVDRHLTFLGPGSLRMTVNGVERMLDRWQDICFLGEDAVTSEPSESSARDLNVMVRRGARTLRATPTVGVTTISPSAAVSVMWISLEPGGFVDKQSVAELDLAMLSPTETVKVEGRGLHCEIRMRTPAVASTTGRQRRLTPQHLNDGVRTEGEAEECGVHDDRFRGDGLAGFGEAAGEHPPAWIHTLGAGRGSPITPGAPPPR